MNTDTVEKEVVRNDITRKITESYTLGTYRVKVSTWHDKNRKAYLTSVSECQIERRDGYTMERHAIFANYYKTIKAERVSRYSFKSLEVFHDSTAEEVAVIVASLIDSHSEKERAE
jgi:hypothetical protein